MDLFIVWRQNDKLPIGTVVRKLDQGYRVMKIKQRPRPENPNQAVSVVQEDADHPLLYPVSTLDAFLIRANLRPTQR